MDARIKDVARLAGVSVTSVSRVLNNSEHVSPKLERKVRDAINQLRYSPSFIAKSLKRSKTNLIGVIIPDVTSSYMAMVLSRIEELASGNGYNLLISNIVEDTDKVVKYLNVYEEMRVDGIVLMHGKANDDIRTFLERTSIPVVVHADMGVHVPAVYIDNFHAAYDATSYLIRKGHTRIAHIAGQISEVADARHRYEGFMAACADSAIAVDTGLIRFGDYKLRSGYDRMGELLDAASGTFTALFAASDDMAAGAINCMHDRGLAVPGDISVIGFDGTYIADVVRPRLTTIRQPIGEIGEKTMQLLLAFIEQRTDEQLSTRRIVLKHELIEKDSCCSIDGRG
ncbi:LacI family transcriptional regulator [Paenibacillus sp. J5C_2022]|uniref:LacI family DNA-binding transcriptional regulator n=1 Tax=Paenibacillus sp. J5C2022 TaxID=2977129 RepID=UPI0021D1B754|nr:LacI family DNA-binding transcriptional regulator [Paenibacillus sp. J5C2022]MCU6710958.1 LacI family transcriptional regulator [Paenibacillus sp. J5C2022]